MAGAEGPGLAAGGGCALRPFHSCCRRAKQRPVKASWPIGPVCRPSAAPVDFLDDSEQARQLRTCLNDTGMPLDLRVAAALVLVVVLWAGPAVGVDFLKTYQKERLTCFTHPATCPVDARYNVEQSIAAVGSGQIKGRGPNGATQTRLDFLPEHQTDFVFASFSEQRGFIGASLLLATLAGIFYGRAWMDRRRVLASGITHTLVDVVWTLWFRR